MLLVAEPLLNEMSSILVPENVCLSIAIKLTMLSKLFENSVGYSENRNVTLFGRMIPDRIGLPGSMKLPGP